MHLSSLTLALLLPLLALADSTSTTIYVTSTATSTRTQTVSRVVASVTSTFASIPSAAFSVSANGTTVAGPTAVGTTSHSSSTKSPASATEPANFMGAAACLSGGYAGGAGVVVMIAAALL